MKALRDAVKKSRRDTFPQGTVIRWTASDTYTYAAIKTGAGWFTTARAANPFVPQSLDFDDLLDVLSRAEVSEVEVSDTWKPVEA